MKQTIGIILFIGWIVSFAQDREIIVFMGDSFTAGDGVPKEKAFPTLIDQKPSIKAFNQGRSGWPTASYLKRWDEVMKKFPERVDQVFIQLGGNDLRINGFNKSTINQCIANMDEITNRLERKYPKVKITLMSSVKVEDATLTPKIKAAGFSEAINSYFIKTGKKFKKLAKEKNYGYVDLIAILPQNSTHDGVHLNEKGHQAVAKRITEFLELPKE